MKKYEINYHYKSKTNQGCGNSGNLTEAKSLSSAKRQIRAYIKRSKDNVFVKWLDCFEL